MHTHAKLGISEAAYAEIAALLKGAGREDDEGAINMQGIDICAVANPLIVERHLVQIKIGPDKWIDLFACETAKEAADFMLTVCSGNAVHLRAVHLRSFATEEELT